MNIKEIEKLPYERRELILRGMNISQWMSLSDEEIMKTEDFSYLHGLKCVQANKDIKNSKEEYENAIPMEKERNYSNKLEYPYQSKQAKKIQMDRTIERYTDEFIVKDTLKDIKNALSSLEKNLDDGHYYYPLITDKVERGFAIMDALGWKKIVIEFSGGGDQGGIDSIKITPNEGDKIDEDDWAPKGVAPLIPVLGRTNGWQESTLLTDDFSSLFWPPRTTNGYNPYNYFHTPCDKTLVFPEAIFWADINNYFGGWTCNYVGGHLTWDNDKDSKNYRKHPALDFSIDAPVNEIIPI